MCHKFCMTNRLKIYFLSPHFPLFWVNKQRPVVCPLSNCRQNTPRIAWCVKKDKGASAEFRSGPNVSTDSIYYLVYPSIRSDGSLFYGSRIQKHLDLSNKLLNKFHSNRKLSPHQQHLVIHTTSSKKKNRICSPLACEIASVLGQHQIDCI